MPSISLRRVRLQWDRGWPCKPHRNPEWKCTHKFDWSELQTWPWWKLGFSFVRLDTTPPAKGWGFWIYSRRGGRRIDIYISKEHVPATVTD